MIYMMVYCEDVDDYIVFEGDHFYESYEDSSNYVKDQVREKLTRKLNENLEDVYGSVADFELKVINISISLLEECLEVMQIWFENSPN